MQMYWYQMLQLAFALLNLLLLLQYKYSEPLSTQPFNVYACMPLIHSSVLLSSVVQKVTRYVASKIDTAALSAVSYAC